MGYLTPEEQLEVKKKYHMLALYKCDYCGNPISILEMAVINPKGGYHKWDKDRSPPSCRPFHSREPKVTYHQGYCNDERLGKKHKENKMPKNKKSKKGKATKKAKGNPKIMKAVLKLITSKPAHYGKKRLVSKFSEKYDKAEVRASLDALWAKEGNADGKVRFKPGTTKYVLYEGKSGKSKKHKKDSSDSSDSDDE